MAYNPSYPYQKGVHYPNDWKLYMLDTEIQKYVLNCANMINNKFDGIPIVLVCILKGASWFFCDLTKKLTIPYTTYFIEASSYKNGQTQEETVEILSRIVPSKFNNKKVILVDELYDNGTTMENIKKAVSDKANVSYDDIYTMALFKKNKPSTHKYTGTLDMYGVDVADVWLVGYGLDDQQEKRGWIHLFAVPKIEGIPKTNDDYAIFGK